MWSKVNVIRRQGSLLLKLTMIKTYTKKQEKLFYQKNKRPKKIEMQYQWQCSKNQRKVLSRRNGKGFRASQTSLKRLHKAAPLCFNSQDMEATWMSINRGMDKEDIYDRILLSPKKERNVPFAETWMDLETVTQNGKSQKGKRISYINAYMWYLEKGYRWTYLQSRNRDTDAENKCMDTKRGEGWVGWIGRLRLTYITTDTMYKIDN